MGFQQYTAATMRDSRPPAGAPESPVPADLREVLGLRFWDATLTRVARYLVSRAQAGDRAQVFFVNAHCVNVAARAPHYAGLLADAPFLLADGAGMALAARICGTRLANNVNGTDLFPVLCEAAAATSTPIALLGARPGVARACAERMQQAHPGLQVAWVGHGYLSHEEEAAALDEINSSGARLLFVAKGVPAQELWIAANEARLAPPVVLGVGALFDFFSGSIPRAPRLMRELRLEWLFRLLQEPRRLAGRYVLGNPEFVARVVAWRVSSAAGSQS